MSFAPMAVIHPWNNMVHLTTNLLTSHLQADQCKSGFALCTDILPFSKG